MFNKHWITLLMATVVTSALAFIQQEDESPQEKQEPLQAVLEEGKFFIIDDEGEKREIEVSDARSIVIRSSNKLIDDNGDQQQEAFGEAIIIGPDGNKTVIELNGAGAVDLPMGLQLDSVFEVDFPEMLEVQNIEDFAMPNFFRIENGVEGKFMIGVHCTPADDALRSHLRLEDEMGLIVRSVNPGSPAGEANVEVHDILMYADDTELRSTSDLTAAIESAGEEGRPTTLTLIRQGAEATVEVSPIARPENEFSSISGIQFEPGQRFQFQQMGPGIIVNGEEDMSETVKLLRIEVRQMQDDMKQMMERDK